MDIEIRNLRNNIFERPELMLETSRCGKFVVSQLELIFSDLPESLWNYRMVQLTDLHYGSSTSLGHLTQAIGIINDLDPHLVLLTGDYIQIGQTGLRHALATRLSPSLFRWSSYRRAVRSLVLDLKSLLTGLNPTDGIIGVFGNHDYLEGIGTIKRKLGDEIAWLKNSNISIKKPGAKLEIAGIDDFGRGEPCITKTFKGLSNAELGTAVRIMLSHNPDIILLDSNDLIQHAHIVLCGHTHGGQIRLPLLPPLLTRTRQRAHITGLSYHKETPVYVSNGVGYGGVPIRAFCPPEITLITLRQK